MGDRTEPAVPLKETLLFALNLIPFIGGLWVLWALRVILVPLPGLWIALLALVVAHACYCYGPLLRACVAPRPNEDATNHGAKATVLWWEKRRFAYNLVLLGVVLLVLRQHFVPLVSQFWHIAAEFAIVANVCYSLGPLSDICLQSVLKRRIAQARDVVFWVGLSFSVWWAGMWALRGLGQL